MVATQEKVAVGKSGASRNLILAALSDGKAKSHREIVKLTGLKEKTVWDILFRAWKKGLILRTKKPIFQPIKIRRGRAGISKTTRSYHLYMLKPEGIGALKADGNEFVGYRKEFLDARGGGGRSKAKAILEFLRSHQDRAWFSKEISESLKGEGVRICDVMANVRRFERHGLVYVRGYALEERQTPFKEGFLITYLDKQKPREHALNEAIDRTSAVLGSRASASPVIERIHRIRDIVIEHSKLRKLVGFVYIQNKLGCSDHEAERAVTRAFQLYPDLKQVKLFNAYRYYYHESLPPEEQQAAIKMKENYIRITKGRENRIGHNWEAAAEWFIDKYTVGAHFWTQTHRADGMDPRRITLHLIRGVHGRRNAAEVDRVWDVTPGVFAPPVTYVLSCKWGLIRKEDVDDFMEVLRWSKDFGVDTPDGRQKKQGVYGVFAGQAFNPKENVKIKNDVSITLASYASRMNIQLLKASDFNERLHKRGCQKTVTVQSICRIARDEKETREVLSAIWEEPDKSTETIREVGQRNEDIYRFERSLEKTGFQ